MMGGAIPMVKDNHGRYQPRVGWLQSGKTKGWREQI
jgi:hypothetical protein